MFELRTQIWRRRCAGQHQDRHAKDPAREQHLPVRELHWRLAKGAQGGSEGWVLQQAVVSGRRMIEHGPLSLGIGKGGVKGMGFGAHPVERLADLHQSVPFFACGEFDGRGERARIQHQARVCQRRVVEFRAVFGNKALCLFA